MDIEEIIGYVVNRCAFSLRQTFFDFMAYHGHELTPEEGTILNQLWLKDGLTQSELLQIIYKGPSTLSRQLDSLERKCLIQRKPGLDDKRKTRICLTKKGKNMEKELIAYSEQLINTLRHGIDPKEIDRAIKTLNQLRENAIKFSEELKS